MHTKTAFTLAIATLLLAGCLPSMEQVNSTEPKDALASVQNTPRELLFNDLFAGDFVSTNVTVLGISVGMDSEAVTTKLGEPDRVAERDFGGVKDFIYAESLGLLSSGVIYHTERGVVTRIIVTEQMAPLLQGRTKPGRTKEEVYSIHGIPDRQYDFSFQLVGKPEDVVGISGRFFVYNTQGLEVYLDREGEYQYAFVYPRRKLPSLAFQTRNLSKEELLNPSLPVLMTDTTTLCDQGATFGYNPAGPDCEPFSSSCTIPDSWIEVESCEQRPPYTPPNQTNSS